ncbi:hypothetical protein AMTRI_Chr13g91670 [Amborella trichopoda]
MCSSDLSWLCTLFKDSIMELTDCGPIILSEERERDTLIRLSQVSQLIRQRMDSVKLKKASEQGVLMNVVCEDKSDRTFQASSPMGHDCLNIIMPTLVVFLTFASQFVRHSAGKVFLVLSNFLGKYGNKWEKLIYFLWSSLEAAIFSIDSSFPLIIGDAQFNHITTKTTEVAFGNVHSDCHNKSSASFTTSRLMNANWFTITEIIRILRTILKSLKPEDELFKIYMKCANAYLSSVFWDLLEMMKPNYSNGSSAEPYGELLFNRDIGFLDSHVLGMMLQLLCSLVKRSGSEEVSGSLVEDFSITTEVSDLVPELSVWCLVKPGKANGECISGFLRHKMMMLMIRLCDHIHQQGETLEFWLELLCRCCSDILYKQISEGYVDHGDFLEGSPFLSSLSEKSRLCSVSTRHLQRQAIFLLFKFSIRLMNLENETTGRRAFSSMNSQCDVGFPSNQGMKELMKWLQWHVPSTRLEADNTNCEECSRFRVAFLNLFVEEDDILFEMLLQLLDIPNTGPPIHNDGISMRYDKLKDDFHSHLSNIFNPIFLFHTFLSGIRYDYLLLLDYLISKDIGVLCLQYLLRCLRLVCNSWPIFKGFSMPNHEMNQLCCKRREVSVDGRDFVGKVLPLSSSVEGISATQPPRTGHKKRKGKTSGESTFENAEECLLSLKYALENLHKKNLFPYNPTALLRSLEYVTMSLDHENSK